MTDKVEVTHLWLDPREYEYIVDAESGIKMTDSYPSGAMVRMVGGQALEIRNGTRDEFYDFMQELEGSV